MRNKIIGLVLTFFFFAFTLKAHIDIYNTIRYENLQVNVGTGFFKNEFQQIGKIIAKQCNDYLLANYEAANLPLIYIKLFENYYYDDLKEKEQFFLGYDTIGISKDSSFYLISTDNTKDIEMKKEALIILVNTRVIKGGNILKLLSFGLDNKEQILKKQILKEKTRYKKINSIPKEEIKSVGEKTNLKINNILAKKYWDEDKRYYSVEDKYHYIREDYEIVLDHIFDIEKCENSGEFLFDSDSTFYYISFGKMKSFTKYTINGVLKGRLPLNSHRNSFCFRQSDLQYYADTMSIRNRFEIYIEKSSFVKKKILFFPELEEIIDNYDRSEKDLINKLLGQDKSNSKNNGMIYFILFISTIISSYLIMKKSPNKS